MLITARHLGSLTLTGEKLGLFGNGHTGLGAATLQASGGTLTIGNLGLSGNNGVMIDLDASRSFLVMLNPLPPATQITNPFPWLQARAYGRFGGTDHHDLGSLRFTALAGGGVQMDVDFTPVGASTHSIEVYRSGQLVRRIAGHTGVVGTVDA